MDGYLQLTLGAAFLAGLSGGAHCAAMCGPLIGISCGNAGRPGTRPWLRRALAYNAGRIASYVSAGAITGALGSAALTLRGMPIVQQAALFAMSLSMLLLAAYLAGLAPFVAAVERAGASAWQHLAPLTRRFLPVDSASRAFGAGVVFGWLPCGMVYVALVAALASGEAAHGALVMGAFGLGTLPNVLAISAWFSCLPAVAQSRAARAVFAVVIASIGLLGVLKAVHPSAVSALGQCLDLPGIGGIFGAH